MTFGQIIKKLRRDRDMTQEDLADILSISSQAISRWENDIAMPDISLFPTICNLFDVTSDELLGINIKKKEMKIQEIVEEAKKIQVETGNFQQAANILSKGYSLFPNSHRIMNELASALICSYTRNQGVQNCDEAINLCNKVIKESTDMELRNEAIQTLCSAYSYANKKEDLIRLAKQMPEAGFSREDLLFHSLSGKDAVKNKSEYILFCFSRVVRGLLDLANTKDDGKYMYSDNDRLIMYKQSAEITKMFFCDGDYHFFAHYGENAYYDMACVYMRKGDSEKALDCLEEAVEFSSHFDTYACDASHTSSVVRNVIDGGWIMEKDGNRSAQVLDELIVDKLWDAVREDKRFVNILEKLKKYARKPE